MELRERIDTAVQRRRGPLCRGSGCTDTHPGRNHEKTLRIQDALAFNLRLQGRHEEALDLYSENFERWVRFAGEKDGRAIFAESQMALEYSYLGQNEESERRFEEVLRKQRRVLGAHDPSIFTTMINLAAVCRATGNDERALALYSDALRGYQQIYGEDHGTTHWAMGLLLQHCLKMKRWEDADSMAVSLFERSVRVFGEDHEQTRDALQLLASQRAGAGRFEEALELQKRLLSIERSALGSEQPARSTIWRVRGLSQAVERVRCNLCATRLPRDGRMPSGLPTTPISRPSAATPSSRRSWQT